jgi:hypothetical protein
MAFHFCNKKVMAQKIGYSHHTLRTFRERGDWIEGIHYERVNSRTIRYNTELCSNWLANQHNPKAHQKAIEQYLESLEKRNRE